MCCGDLGDLRQGLFATISDTELDPPLVTWCMHLWWGVSEATYSKYIYVLTMMPGKVSGINGPVPVGEHGGTERVPYGGAESRAAPTIPQPRPAHVPMGEHGEAQRDPHGGAEFGVALSVPKPRLEDPKKGTIRPSEQEG